MPSASTAPNQTPATTTWSVAQHDTIPQVDMWFNYLDKPCVTIPHTLKQLFARGAEAL
jgi:hypothetical protein